MDIKIFQAGPLSANNYLITDSGESVLIDCSQYIPEVLEGVNLKYVILTHGHFDHSLGVNETKKCTNAKVLVNKSDIARFEESPQIMEMMFSTSGIEIPQADEFIYDNDVLKFGNTQIKAIHTPGHTQGSMSYLIGDKLFSGDTLFKDYVGRCDLPGGDLNKMKESIKKLFMLNDDTVVYSGHGDKTTIGYEKKFNEINRY